MTNSIKELQAKIKPNYDDVVQCLNQNKSTIILWGASSIGGALVNWIGESHELIIWDTSRGETFKNLPIVRPQFDLDDDVKRNAYVIMAFVKKGNYAICGKMLKDNGFRHIINGHELIQHISASKVINDYHLYKTLNKNQCFEIQDDKLRLVTSQMHNDASTPFNSYMHNQNLWALKKIYADKPLTHYDIGSNVPGFIVPILSFETKVVLIDIRPMDSFDIENLSFIRDDAKNLSTIEDDSIGSLSCLGTLQSVGLGQYNDQVDPDADLKVINSIQRVLRKDANLYLSVVVSRKNYMRFNSNRGYEPNYIVDKFNKCKLVEFSYVPVCNEIIMGSGITKSESLNLPKDSELTIVGNDHYYYWGLFHFQKC